MLAQTKRWLYDRKLSNKLSLKSSTGKDPLNPSQKIAILFDASDLYDKSEVQQFADQLSYGNRQVKLLGYINTKADNADVGFLSYNKKNIDWLGIPKSDDTELFLQKEFDILIALLPEWSRHYEYLIKMSNAKLKIGPNFSGSENHFDLIIDVHPPSIQNLINHIIVTLDKVGH